MHILASYVCVVPPQMYSLHRYPMCTVCTIDTLCNYTYYVTMYTGHHYQLGRSVYRTCRITLCIHTPIRDSQGLGL